MQITLYNTCPDLYEKKFSQILKQVIRPALKEGKSVRVDEISEERRHSKTISSFSGGKKVEGSVARYCLLRSMTKESMMVQLGRKKCAPHATREE